MKRGREKIDRPFLTKLDFDIVQTPFTIWLKTEKGKDIFDLKETKKQKYFEKFRNNFNNDELDLKYYEIYERETKEEFNEIEKPKSFEEIQIEKKKEKEYIKQRKSDLEELVPKPDPGSFLAKKQKNKAKYYKEDSPDPGDSTYDDDSTKQFERMLQKQKNKKLEKIIEKERMIQEIKEKERIRMEEFKKTINLKKFNTNK
eukprot:gene12485-6233_t